MLAGYNAQASAYTLTTSLFPLYCNHEKVECCCCEPTLAPTTEPSNGPTISPTVAADDLSVETDEPTMLPYVNCFQV